MHRGWHVRHPRSSQDGHRERLPRSSEQSCESLRQVQCDATLHDVQLRVKSFSFQDTLKALHVASWCIMGACRRDSASANLTSASLLSFFSLEVGTDSSVFLIIKLHSENKVAHPELNRLIKL